MTTMKEAMKMPDDVLVYAMVTPDRTMIRRCSDDKLIINVVYECMTVHDTNDVVIYTLNFDDYEGDNINEDTSISTLINLAWGDGFADVVMQALVAAGEVKLQVMQALKEMHNED